MGCNHGLLSKDSKSPCLYSKATFEAFLNNVEISIPILTIHCLLNIEITRLVYATEYTIFTEIYDGSVTSLKELQVLSEECPIWGEGGG